MNLGKYDAGLPESEHLASLKCVRAGGVRAGRPPVRWDPVSDPPFRTCSDPSLPQEDG
jgi:hypothetical protein